MGAYADCPRLGAEGAASEGIPRPPRNGGGRFLFLPIGSDRALARRSDRSSLDRVEPPLRAGPFPRISNVPNPCPVEHGCVNGMNALAKIVVGLLATGTAVVPLAVALDSAEVELNQPVGIEHAAGSAYASVTALVDVLVTLDLADDPSADVGANLPTGAGAGLDEKGDLGTGDACAGAHADGEGAWASADASSAASAGTDAAGVNAMAWAAADAGVNGQSGGTPCDEEEAGPESSNPGPNSSN